MYQLQPDCDCLMLISTLGNKFGFTEKGSPNGVTVKDCLRETAKCDFDQRYDITESKRNC